MSKGFCRRFSCVLFTRGSASGGSKRGTKTEHPCQHHRHDDSCGFHQSNLSIRRGTSLPSGRLCINEEGCKHPPTPKHNGLLFRILLFGCHPYFLHSGNLEGGEHHLLFDDGRGDTPKQQRIIEFQQTLFLGWVAILFPPK